jgi:hypothetical protein
MRRETNHHYPRSYSLNPILCRPDLRDEIISLSLLDVEAACGVLLDIGKHMVIDVETTEASTIESIQRVVAQLSDMARWKLAPVFFEKYPQWAWTSAC